MDYRFENLSYFVLICGHTNAAFMQREHAQAHFDYCVMCQADLPTLDIALVKRDGTTIAREKRSQPSQPTTVVGMMDYLKQR